MMTRLFDQLIKDGGIWGVLVVLMIFGVIYLFKQLMSEKNKEIEDARAVEAKVTLVIQAMDNTMKTILVYLEHEKK